MDIRQHIEQGDPVTNTPADWEAECGRLRRMIRAMAETDARMVLLFQLGSRADGRDVYLTVTAPVEPLPEDLRELIGCGFAHLIELLAGPAEGGAA